MVPVSPIEQLTRINNEQKQTRGKSKVLCEEKTPALILTIMEDPRGWSSNELQTLLCLRRATINGALRRLVELGKIVQTGTRKTTAGNDEYIYKKVIA